MITILGPTASGKTPVAAHLAAEIGGEIISADSRQVYRRWISAQARIWLIMWLMATRYLII